MITPRRTYYLVADSHGEMFSWKEALIFAVQQVRGAPKASGYSQSASTQSISTSALSPSVTAVSYNGGGSSTPSKAIPLSSSSTSSYGTQYARPESQPLPASSSQQFSGAYPKLQHSQSQPNFSRSGQQFASQPPQQYSQNSAVLNSSTPIISPFQYGQQSPSNPPSPRQQMAAQSPPSPRHLATAPSPRQISTNQAANRQAAVSQPPAPDYHTQPNGYQTSQNRISPSSSPTSSPSSAYWSRYLQEETVKVTVDDFEILAVVGVGSYGTVAQVRHKRNGQIYALKVLNKKDIIQRSEESHTKAEKIILASVNHPFLMNLHYSFQTPDQLFFVMDFVNGGEMFYHLQREQNFDLNRARFYAAEIFLGIEYLHSRGIIYRYV